MVLLPKGVLYELQWHKSATNAGRRSEQVGSWAGVSCVMSVRRKASITRKQSKTGVRYIMTETNQAIRNALDDLETSARMLEEEGVDSFHSDMIRESVQILREELGEEHD